MKKFLIISLFSLSLFAKQTSLFVVEGMHCPLCTTAVKKAIRSLNGIEKVSVKLNTKEVTVIYDEKSVTTKDILKAIKTTSYEGILKN